LRSKWVGGKAVYLTFGEARDAAEAWGNNFQDEGRLAA